MAACRSQQLSSRVPRESTDKRTCDVSAYDRRLYMYYMFRIIGSKGV